MKGPLIIGGFIILVIVLLIFGGWVTLWVINTLWGISTPLTLKTWFAATLFNLLVGSTVRNSSK